MLQQSMRRHTPNDLVVDRHSSPRCASDFAMMTEASCALPVWRRCMRRVDWPPGRAVSLQVDSTPAAGRKHAPFPPAQVPVGGTDALWSLARRAMPSQASLGL